MKDDGRMKEMSSPVKTQLFEFLKFELREEVLHGAIDKEKGELY